jgi:hypothetical protein
MVMLSGGGPAGSGFSNANTGSAGSGSPSFSDAPSGAPASEEIRLEDIPF